MIIIINDDKDDINDKNNKDDKAVNDIINQDKFVSHVIDNKL